MFCVLDNAWHEDSSDPTTDNVSLYHYGHQCKWSDISTTLTRRNGDESSGFLRWRQQSLHHNADSLATVATQFDARLQRLPNHCRMARGCEVRGLTAADFENYGQAVDEYQRRLSRLQVAENYDKYFACSALAG